MPRTPEFVYAQTNRQTKGEIEGLRQQPAGMDIGQYCTELRAAIGDCIDAQDAISDAAQMAGREKLFASEQREHDRLQERREELANLLARAASSPEGRSIDYRSQVDLGYQGNEDDAGPGYDPFRNARQEASAQNPYSRGDSHAGGRWHHTGGGHVYNPDDQRRSWVRDIIAARVEGDSEARDRLRRNDVEVLGEQRAMTTGAGSAGEFVVPKYMLDEMVRLARAGRVIADQMRRLPMPGGTDSITVPRMTGGTAVQEYTTEGAEVHETDAGFDSITADITVLAGGQTLSVQSIEQSGAAVDQIVMADLMADLATKVDRFVIANNATRKLGILSVPGINTVSFTSGSPTVAGLNAKLADGISQIHSGRLLPPTKVFAHPRRWAWMTAQADTTGRPLVVPVAQMPSNVLAAMGAVASEGLVGSMAGLPVYVDPNLPINLGAGSNEDRVIVMRPEDAILWESIPRASAFPEPYAKTLQVYLRLHSYVAFQAGRYPRSISVLQGTGLSTPSF